MDSPRVPLSRRDFFLRAGVLGVAGAAAVATTVAPLGQSTAHDLELSALSEASFAPLIGSTFQLVGDDGTQVTARLGRTRRLRAPGTAGVGRDDPFALIFRSRRDAGLVQQTYRVEHESLGCFTAMLVPVGLPEGETKLEVIFA